MSTDPTLGEVLQKARLDANLGVRELARRAGVDPSYLSMIERNQRVPSARALRAIREALGMGDARMNPPDGLPPKPPVPVKTLLQAVYDLNVARFKDVTDGLKDIADKLDQLIAILSKGPLP